MSRRHKTPEEIERIQSRQRVSQGGSSLEATSDKNCSARYHSELNKLLVIKRDSKCIRFSLEKIIDAITNSICSIDMRNFASMHEIETSVENKLTRQHYLTEQIQQAIAKEIEAQEKMEDLDSMAKRGRRKINQLLGRFKNNEVLSWFEKIRSKFDIFISSVKEMMVCFFCALFDVIPSENRHGKAACFYEMVDAHLKEKIPSKSMFQKALKWFKGWRKEVTPWKDRNAEEEEHSIWEKLYHLIMKELPILEPRLAVC